MITKKKLLYLYKYFMYRRLFCKDQQQCFFGNNIFQKYIITYYYALLTYSCLGIQFQMQKCSSVTIHIL